MIFYFRLDYLYITNNFLPRVTYYSVQQESNFHSCKTPEDSFSFSIQYLVLNFRIQKRPEKLLFRVYKATDNCD